jgi:hypothetical protein
MFHYDTDCLLLHNEIVLRRQRRIKPERQKNVFFRQSFFLFFVNLEKVQFWTLVGPQTNNIEYASHSSEVLE